ANEKLKALALWAGILLGDYILSFDETTDILRRPRALIYAELLKSINRIIDNQADNRAINMEALDFVIRTKADLLYVNLPIPNSMLAFLDSPRCWREAWVRGHGNIHEAIFPQIKNSFGGVVLSKERYLQFF